MPVSHEPTTWDNAWRIWQIRVTDGVGRADDTVRSQTFGPLAAAAAGLGCRLLDVHSAEAPSGSFVDIMHTWLVGVPAAAHDAAVGTPAVVEELLAVVRSLMPPRLRREIAAAYAPQLSVDTWFRENIRDAYRDLLDPLEAVALPLRREEDLAPPEIWQRGDDTVTGRQVCRYALFLGNDPDYTSEFVGRAAQRDPDYTRTLFLTAGLASSARLRTGEVLAAPVLLYPRPDEPITYWHAELVVGSFEELNDRRWAPIFTDFDDPNDPDLPRGAVGARHQWAATSPEGLVSIVQRDLPGLIAVMSQPDASMP